MRWEYCAVVGIDRRSLNSRDLYPHWPALWYFTSTGVRQRDIRGDEVNEAARTIATLGDEGWEMVGVGGTSGDILYFKRPKP